MHACFAARPVATDLQAGGAGTPRPPKDWSGLEARPAGADSITKKHIIMPIMFTVLIIMIIMNRLSSDRVSTFPDFEFDQPAATSGRERARRADVRDHVQGYD